MGGDVPAAAAHLAEAISEFAPDVGWSHNRDLCVHAAERAAACVGGDGRGGFRTCDLSRVKGGAGAFSGSQDPASDAGWRPDRAYSGTLGYSLIRCDARG
jgi:hypothetical protein